ncbi:hypothetical protein ABK040_009552 [Willaertia magna]
MNYNCNKRHSSFFSFLLSTITTILLLSIIIIITTTSSFVESKKSFILFSSLLDHQYKHTGYYSEAIHYVIPLIKQLNQFKKQEFRYGEHSNSELSIFLDKNCNYWDHIGGCENENNKNLDETLSQMSIQQIINRFSLNSQEEFNHLLNFYNKFILIRHLPINWFDFDRRQVYEDSFLLENGNVHLLLNNSYFYCLNFNCEIPFIRVIRTMYESDKVPELWVRKLNLANEVWVPSNFNKKTFIESGVDEKRIRVIPEAIDTEFWNKKSIVNQYNEFDNQFADDTFVFLSVFKWEERKGPELLLSSFINQFSSNDKVCLVLKLDLSLISKDILNQMNIKDGEKITTSSNYGFLRFFFDYVKKLRRRGVNMSNVIIERSIDDFPCIIIYSNYFDIKRMRFLFARANAYVSTTKGEGWGLPLIQAMSMGLPVISTDYGGSTEFMKQDNSYLIPVERMEESPSFHGKLAIASVDHVRRTFRLVMKRRDEAIQKGQLAQQFIQENFSIKKVNELILKEVKRLLKTIHSPREEGIDNNNNNSEEEEEEIMKRTKRKLKLIVKH